MGEKLLPLFLVFWFLFAAANFSRHFFLHFCLTAAYAKNEDHKWQLFPLQLFYSPANIIFHGRVCFWPANFSFLYGRCFIFAATLKIKTAIKRWIRKIHFYFRANYFSCFSFCRLSFMARKIKIFRRIYSLPFILFSAPVSLFCFFLFWAEIK